MRYCAAESSTALWVGPSGCPCLQVEGWCEAIVALLPSGKIDGFVGSSFRMPCLQVESWCEAIVELLRSGKLDGSVGGSFWRLRPRAESWCEAIVELL